MIKLSLWKFLKNMEKIIGMEIEDMDMEDIIISKININ